MAINLLDSVNKPAPYLADEANPSREDDATDSLSDGDR